MPVETPPPVVQAYALLLLLGGIVCFIHFFFFLKGAKKIEPHNAVPGWQLGFSDFFFGFFTIVLTVLLAVTALRAFVIIDPENDGVATEIILYGGAMHLAALGVLYTFYKTLPGKFQDPLDSRKVSWGQSAKVAFYSFLVVIPIIYPLTYAWQFALETLGMELPAQETVLIFSQIDRLPILILMILLTVVIAPLSEEILFRGCLYRFLKAKTSIIFALVTSGVLFALLHQNLLSFLPLFVLGVALAYAYERTGSIKVPILIHGIFNLNTVIIIVLTMNPA